MSPTDMPVALSIAGSDSGGGAGIQADLRTFRRLGVFGTTAVTAITAQNLSEVVAVDGVRPDLVRVQIDAVVRGFRPRAAKTGMLWCDAIIRAVVDAIRNHELPVVVDPVMVATSGARLLDSAAIASYGELLCPLAALITPNLDEAAVLLGEQSVATNAPAEVARELCAVLGAPVLLKGGHGDGDPVDTLATGNQLKQWRHRRVPDVNTHGSGCILAAAITARLAGGDTLVDACERGLAFVHDALHRGAAGRAHNLADLEHANIELSHLSRMEPS